MSLDLGTVVSFGMVCGVLVFNMLEFRKISRDTNRGLARLARGHGRMEEQHERMIRQMGEQHGRMIRVLEQMERRLR